MTKGNNFTKNFQSYKNNIYIDIKKIHVNITTETKLSKLKVQMNDNVWFLYTYFMINGGNLSI